MVKILVVDDEQHIIELVTLYLEHEEYQVTGVGTGEAARAELQAGGFDLVILDLMLPDIDGFALCAEIRSQSDVPILMLTARKEDVDKIVGLEIGADDYLTKPFNPRELVARVRAILRRRKAGSKTTGVIEVGKLRIDLSRHEVTVAGAPIALRSKEFALLATLAQNLGIVFSREKLLETVWGYDYYGETRTVDVHINHLRDKLSGSDVRIETIRGTGYKMKAAGKQK
jgi:DNA-binding response OmpR family regulator